MGIGKPHKWEWELPALPWEFIPKVLCCDELIKLLVLYLPDANAYCVGGKRASVQHCWSPAGKAANQSESRVDQRVAVSSQQHEVKL